MLPRKNRYVFGGAFPKKIVHTPFLTIRYAKSEGALHAAIVVSKKTSKKATERNRMKRLLSESLHKHKQSNYSVVLFVKKLAFSTQKRELQDYVDSSLNSLLE